MLVVLERLLEVGEVALLVCACDGAHTLDVPQLRVLRSELHAQQGCDIFGLQSAVSIPRRRLMLGRTHQVQHDLAEEHVLQCAERARVVLCTETLEGLVEVGVCSRIVLVLCVKDTRLQIQSCLQVWWAVDGVGRCPC